MAKRKVRSAPLLVIRAVDRRTVREAEAAIKRILKSDVSNIVKAEAVKALRTALLPRPVHLANCNFSGA